MSWEDNKEKNSSSSSSSSSILVNAHYDSFVSSPGASDDALGVAIMLGRYADADADVDALISATYFKT